MNGTSASAEATRTTCRPGALSIYPAAISGQKQEGAILHIGDGTETHYGGADSNAHEPEFSDRRVQDAARNFSSRPVVTIRGAGRRRAQARETAPVLVC